jgi:hypothetical protein
MRVSLSSCMNAYDIFNNKSLHVLRATNFLQCQVVYRVDQTNHLENIFVIKIYAISNAKTMKAC